MKGYPYAFHIALDGNGVNGLEGLAGVCLFLYDPEADTYAYKIAYFDGIAAGHAVSLNPSGTVGFLGNAGQHLLFYDAVTLAELDRISTLRFEPAPTSLQGSTHLIWLSDREFMTPIGENFYRFSLDDLTDPKRLGPHRVKLPHAMKITGSGRYICYGSMDSPAYGRDGEARHVGVWDLETDEASVVELPATCWHVVAAPGSDVFYAVSFRVEPTDHVDWHDWAMAFKKEYVFEIDAAQGQVLRHWAGGREIPAHINSDLTLSDTEVIFCNGGSQSIVCIDRETLSSFRIIDERPDLEALLQRPREVVTQTYDALARANVFGNSNHVLGALRVSRFSLLDSVYAAQLCADQSLLFTANRGLNHITVYDYPDATVRLRVDMPPIQDFQPFIGPLADRRLGFHHSVVLG
ncbi:MAG: hypothetical protein KY462_15995 [Actinobacteria bacterium]|nr:hypothetical protein [Actinomycetota bacterium]